MLHSASQVEYEHSIKIPPVYHTQNPSDLHSHTVTITEAFSYQLSIGFSPFRVIVSSTYAHSVRNSRWVWTLLDFPVMAWYISAIKGKSVGKRISKNP